VAFVVVTLLQAITFSFHTTTVPSFVTDFFVAIGASLLVLYMARTTRTHYLATATLAATDPLTNLANRRAFVAALESEIARQQRYGGVVSLAILDLDEFKMLNDSKGHYAGDEALKIAAALLRSETRKSDLVARIGGDEFAILMPNTFDFERMLQQLCSRIAEDMSAASFPVTASIGCKTFGTPPQDASEAMRQVDALMYEAKSRGRNCVVWSPQLIG
jgi:diguanylate cyclase (GGDEF)-like protein